MSHDVERSVSAVNGSEQRLCRCRRSHQVRFVSRGAMTVLELTVVMMIMGVLVALLLPAVHSIRESSRRMTCQTRLRQVALAMHHYHSAFGHLPMQGGGTRTEATRPMGSGENWLGNQFSLSCFVSILPYVEQQALWEQISHPMPSTKHYPIIGNSWPAMGPFPTEKTYSPWATEITTYQCPSQPTPLYSGGINFAVCLGDAVDQIDWGDWQYDLSVDRWQPNDRSRVNTSCRGAWVMRRFCRLASIKDGLSQTLLLGEIRRAVGDNHVTTEPARFNGEAPDGVWMSATTCDSLMDPLRPGFWQPLTQLRPSSEASRGASYASGWTTVTSFNAINSPNGPVCLASHIASAGHLPPSSHHPGGVHTAMADGSVRFVSDSIHAGDPDSQTVFWTEGQSASSGESPFGVWGAMATRAAARRVTPAAAYRQWWVAPSAIVGGTQRSLFRASRVCRHDPPAGRENHNALQQAA